MDATKDEGWTVNRLPLDSAYHEAAIISVNVIFRPYTHA